MTMPVSSRAAAGPVGIIGVGLVGAALVQRLRAAGVDVIGHDTAAAACALLASAGGTVAASPRAVAAQCDRLLLVLLDDEQTDGVIAAAELHAGHLMIDHHTGHPDAARRRARVLAQLGVGYVDAPFSGASGEIAAGTGVAMVGADPATLARCASLLDVIAPKRIVVGVAGDGQAAKLATNLVLGLNRAALAEGLAFAEALGLTGAKFLELVQATPAASQVAASKGPRMLERRYTTPDSRIRQHRKDVALMLSLARAPALSLPLSTAHAAILDRAIAAGDGDLDNTAIAEVMRAASRG